MRRRKLLFTTIPLGHVRTSLLYVFETVLLFPDSLPNVFKYQRHMSHHPYRVHLVASPYNKYYRDLV